jgi:hypothetical protein
MTAIVLPDIDRSTIDELKKRIPDWSEIDLNLPSAKDVGKSADQAIDRLLGRSRRPVWPWVAAAIGLVAIGGVVAAWFAWFRRPAWQGASFGGGAGSDSGGPSINDTWPTSEPSLSTGLDDVDAAGSTLGGEPIVSEARATVMGASRTSIEDM